MRKAIKPKPQFYAYCFAGLQQIATDLGYNLLLHGSMNRDLDLVAIPWIDSPSSHLELLIAFSENLGAPVLKTPNGEYYFMHTVLPGGRDSYVIDLNRGGEFNNYNDEQYYLDISITPLMLHTT